MSSRPSSDIPWSLNGKTAIVMTGGSRGIGQAISIHLARKGLSKLAITYASNIEAAEETVKRCQELGVEQAIATKADALDPQFGIADSRHNIGLVSRDNASNVYGPVSITTALLPHVPDYGGRVINISSILAYQANSDMAVAYGASKTALQSCTRAFAENFSKSKKKAKFNIVIVGLTATDSIKANQHMMQPGFLDGQIRDTTAAERIGVPGDIAYIVSFLASEEGCGVNGAAVSADGGNKPITRWPS